MSSFRCTFKHADSVEIRQYGLSDDGAVVVPPGVVDVGVGVQAERAPLVQRLQADGISAVAGPPAEVDHRQVGVVVGELAVQDRR